jgi:FtsP/CotA-like multicopper oxidase with cupredoxin domain
MAGWKDKLALTAQNNRREIVKANLSRREMARFGLLTAGGALIAKQGLSARWASAETLSLMTVEGVDGPPSPPAAAFAQPMPFLPLLSPADPTRLRRGGPPDGTTVIDGATKRVPHQLFTQFPPQKYYEITCRQDTVQVHPSYAPTTVFGFAHADPTAPDGLKTTVPGPLIRANYGEPVLVRFYNDLPSVKLPAPQGFGIAEMTTHLHNGHTPFESDGNPVDFWNSLADGPNNPVNPLGFRDHHYPNVYAGYTHYGKSLSDLGGDPAEAMGSLWFHDHHLDFTAQNVYKGMFGCYDLFDNVDSSNETDTAPGALRLPSGNYDVPIFFNDFLFDQNCQLVFDLFDLDGILGDRFCANGAIQPYFNVDKRRYRFRLYNPGPSRWWEFALYDGKNFLPFWQISTDGNLLPNAIRVNSVRLAVAERADIIVDFNSAAVGSSKTLYLVNRLEQVNGRGPTGKILTPGTPVVQFKVGSTVGDPSADPSGGNPNAVVGIPLRALPDPDFNALQQRAAKAKTRTWRFERGNGAWQVNGKFFDPDVISANPAQEAEEVWVIQNPGGGWRHPIHIHFEEHRVLSRDGVPTKPNTQVNGTIDYSRRDVVPLNENNEVRIFFRFRDMQGRYVMHCHNVVHEDHAMMIRWDLGTTPF